MPISKYHPGVRWRLRLCRDLLPSGSERKLLDAGCGGGYIARALQDRYRAVDAVDISQQVIEDNQRRFGSPGLQFRTLDLNDLDERDEYDAIICMDVLEHARGFETIIANFARATRAGGVVLLTIPVFDGHGHFSDIGQVSIHGYAASQIRPPCPSPKNLPKHPCHPTVVNGFRKPGHGMKTLAITGCCADTNQQPPACLK